MASRYGVDVDFMLLDQVAIVVGGLGGIGLETSKMLLEKGAKVSILYPSFESKLCEEVESQLNNVKASFFECDITEPSSIEYIFNRIRDKEGQLDLLINCAGFVNLTPAEKTSLEDWNKHLSINLTGPFLCSQLFAQINIKDKRKGKIITLASQAARVAIDGHLSYCTSKAALIGMTKVMAKEWGKYGITVNAISPTVVLTPLGEKAWAGSVGEDMKKLIPIGRFAYPDEIAASVVFLASNGADMITGADLLIDGGFTSW